ncbi:hypothetical protein [Bifidobacterium callimiconis]|uniref:Uncharacterized protein n=1 Tax=Bifidobacterium callimiconis TaxID=2306973 RepID=A0A430FB11_9BIFI|nr:hypothetical protein D2E23_1969 [Bifidobacterium callimiconis]
MFTAEERQYLSSLPAVYYAGTERILYTDEFKYACIARYMDGESPVAIFREAGLDPELVGRKRIERCFARWRDSEGIRRRLSVDRIRMQQERDGGAASAASIGVTPIGETSNDGAGSPSTGGTTARPVGVTGSICGMPASVAAVSGMRVGMTSVGGAMTSTDAPNGVIAAGLMAGGAASSSIGTTATAEAGLSDPIANGVLSRFPDHADCTDHADDTDTGVGTDDTDCTDGTDGTNTGTATATDPAASRTVCMTHDDGCLHTRLPGEPTMMSKGDVLRIRREAVASAVRGENMSGLWNGGRPDARELLLDQQTRRIDELEREIAQLRGVVARSTAVMEHAFARHAARPSTSTSTASTSPSSASARAESRAAHPAGGARP